MNHLASINDALYAIKRFPWLLFWITAIACIVGWGVVYTLPDKYESTARLHMQGESVMGPLLKGLAAESELRNEMVSIIHRTLTSRPYLETLIQSTDLGLRVGSEREKEVLMREIIGQLRIEEDVKNRIFKFGFRDRDPVVARDVVQTLINLFIEGTLGATRKDAQLAQDFLQREIADYERKLAEAETRLKEFKSENYGLLPGAGETNISQLNQRSNELNLARIQYAEAVKRVDALKARSATRATKLARGPVEHLEQELHALRSRYTDRHPDVVALMDRITQAREAGHDNTNGRMGSFGAEDAMQAISMRDLDVETGKAQGELDAARVRVAAFEQQVEGLNQKISVALRVEAEVAQLDRDYDVVKKTYEGLVQRREAALLARQADHSAEDLQFRVIETPNVPIVAGSPNRLILNLGVMAAALGMGLLSVSVLSQLRRVVRNISDLRTLGYGNVLGMITELPRKSDHVARLARSLSLSAAWITLFALFAFVLVAQRSHLIQSIFGG
ncbi:MAG: XrtA system polysaccharide chain length determinant [Thiotrichales bacterium]